MRLTLTIDATKFRVIEILDQLKCKTMSTNNFVKQNSYFCSLTSDQPFKKIMSFPTLLFLVIEWLALNKVSDKGPYIDLFPASWWHKLGQTSTWT